MSLTTITPSIVFDLLLPPRTVCGWQFEVPWTAVPKASVNEKTQPAIHDNDISRDLKGGDRSDVSADTDPRPP
jgi:hypothetical protein